MPNDDRETHVIAAMRLSGHRFNANGMPADSLAEVAAFEDILRSLVRQFWQNRNPSRQRVPKGYDTEIALRLTRIGRGSAVPVLEHDPDLGIGDLFRQDEVRQDYARARGILEQFIEYAQTGQGLIPPEIREVPTSKIKKFGQSLRRDESIQIASTELEDWGQVISYTPATRTGRSPITRPPGSRARIVSSVSVDPALHRVVGVGAGRSVLGRRPVAQR